jgi:Ion channel
MVAVLCGIAMMFQPELGAAVRSPFADTPRDFITAIYVAGTSMITLGTGTLEPQTPAARLLYVFDPVIGMSLMTLTITYIVEIYNALHDRNTLALKLYLMSGSTGDAANLVAALGPGGDFTIAYSQLAEVAAEIVSLKESHNFYPVLFYFRFRDAFYSVSMASLLALDTATLLSTALNQKRYGWLKNAAAVITLREAAALLINTLEQTFLPKRAAEQAPDAEEMVRWRLRYFAALRRLQDAGIETRTDENAGALEYAEIRRRWNPYIRTLAPAMGFAIDEVDPALKGIRLPDEQPQPQPH